MSCGYWSVATHAYGRNDHPHCCYELEPRELSGTFPHVADSCKPGWLPWDG